MNCTQKEFEDKVLAKHPRKWFNQDVSSLGWRTVWVLDTLAEFQLPLTDKNKLAYYIWQSGSVIKDVDGLFGSPTGHTAHTSGQYTGALAVGSPGATQYTTSPVVGGYSLGFDILFKKCECGAHAVKSTRHSSWCPEAKE